MWVISCFLNLVENIKICTWNNSVLFYGLHFISELYKKSWKENSVAIFPQNLSLLCNLKNWVNTFKWMFYRRYFGRFCYCCHITFKGNYYIVKNNHNCKYYVPTGGLGVWRKICCHSPNAKWKKYVKDPAERSMNHSDGFAEKDIVCFWQLIDFKANVRVFKTKYM